ncbi:hypothetical protein NDU88_000741 [Pleurodeles waltl]|uniref:Uncharacterized protein n=1 Tax=Pleurodeles waltl TaxID=8319 RepID=A0AAV7U5I2_PLEWA|nr:hypothetical protein NDU88_000741 [Pleurodeles waltl]
MAATAPLKTPILRWPHLSAARMHSVPLMGVGAHGADPSSSSRYWRPGSALQLFLGDPETERLIKRPSRLLLNKALFLVTTATPVRGTRLGVSLRASCVTAPIISAGGGAAARSRPTPSDPASVDPAPASSGGPRESLGVRVPLRCRLALLCPRLGANDVERPAPGPSAGAPEVRSREGRGGEPSPRAAAAPSERNAPAGCPGRHTLTGGSRSSSARLPAYGTSRRAAARSGAAALPQLRPQPESPSSGRAAARAPQPRLPSDPTGESNGAAPMPRVRHTHIGRANSFFRSGAPIAPCFSCPVRPFRGQQQRVLVSWGHPRFGGGSLFDITPARDQDNQEEGGPRAELFAQVSAPATILATPPSMLPLLNGATQW